MEKIKRVKSRSFSSQLPTSLQQTPTFSDIPLWRCKWCKGINDMHSSFCFKCFLDKENYGELILEKPGNSKYISRVPMTTGDMEVSILNGQNLSSSNFVKVECQNRIPIGSLFVTVHNAINLYDTQLIGKQDPYISICFGNISQRSAVHSNGDTNPSWNHTFTLDLTGNPEDNRFFIEIWNKCISNDEVIAKTPILPIEALIAISDKQKHIIRLGRGNGLKNDAGELIISVTYERSEDPYIYNTIIEGKTSKIKKDNTFNEVLDFEQICSNSYLKLSIMEHVTFGSDIEHGDLLLSFNEICINNQKNIFTYKITDSEVLISIYVIIKNKDFPFGIVPLSIML